MIAFLFLAICSTAQCFHVGTSRKQLSSIHMSASPKKKVEQQCCIPLCYITHTVRFLLSTLVLPASTAGHQQIILTICSFLLSELSYPATLLPHRGTIYHLSSLNQLTPYHLSDCYHRHRSHHPCGHRRARDVQGPV